MLTQTKTGDVMGKFARKVNDKMAALVQGEQQAAANAQRTTAKPFPVRDGVRFSYENLTLTVGGSKNPKVVVDHVSGEVPAATMTAVMGPSGAGKTSFMNVLCDRAGYGVTTGTLKLNGRKDRISNHRDIMGFVPQDDTVHDDLTVRENLLFSAMNRLPITEKANGCRSSTMCSQLRTSMKCKKKETFYMEYVDQVLELLQIGHVQHSIVGSVVKRGISGGQRKRVNIGLELVADPDVLFLDEPTSGLDSTSSEIILAALKDISRKGRTIIMVIHQPRYSIFASMDNVIFLGPGGRCVYSGSPLDANDYFEMLGFYAAPNINLADYFMDVIGGAVPRNNDVGFKPSDLFQFWNDWVMEMKEYNFSSDSFHTIVGGDGGGDGGGAKDDEYEKDEEQERNRSSFVLTPKQLNMVRKLFIEAMVCSMNSEELINTSIKPALTTEASLREFMRLISTATSASIFTNHQTIGIGLAVRVLFHSTESGHSMKASMGKNSFSALLSAMNSESPTSSPRSSSPALSMGSNKSKGSMGSMASMDTAGLVNMVNVEMTPTTGEEEGGAAASKSESPTSRSDGGQAVKPCYVEWSDLSYALSDANTLMDLVNLRTAELIGEDGGVGFEKAPQPNGIIPKRNFGWDHSCAQFGLFGVRYCLKRRRGVTNWLGELVLYAFGAILIGILNGKHSLATFTGAEFAMQYLNLVMIYGILATISSLQTFGSEKLIFWRESSSGISIIAFWAARCLIDLFFFGIQCMIWATLLDDLTEPEMNTNVLVYFFYCQGFANSGMGYLLSTFIPSRNLTLYAALFAALGGFFMSGINPALMYSDAVIGAYGLNNNAEPSFAGRVILWLMSLNFSKHILESLIVSDAMQLKRGKALIYASGQLNVIGYGTLNQVANSTINNYEQPQLSQIKGYLIPDPAQRVMTDSLKSPMWSLFWIGFVSRLLTLIGLFVFDRSQQNKTQFSKLVCQCFMLPCRRKANSKKKESQDYNNLEGGGQAAGRIDLDQRTSIVVSLNPLAESAAGMDMDTADALLSITGSNTKNDKKRRNTRLQLDLATLAACATEERSQETWKDRIKGLGMSSRVRTRKRKEQLALMFELLDRLGDGAIDPDDMKKFSQKFNNQVNVVFGNKTAWKRVENVGLFSHQTFEQFFDWFVLTPTVDAICAAVVQGNKKKNTQLQKKKAAQKKVVRRLRSASTRFPFEESKMNNDSFDTTEQKKPNGRAKNSPSWVGRQKRIHKRQRGSSNFA